MLRTVGFALSLLMLASGLAGADDFNGAKVTTAWYDAHYLCRMGESKDGQKLTNQESDVKCGQRDKLTLVLQSHDFCLDQVEQEWTPCKTAKLGKK